MAEEPWSVATLRRILTPLIPNGSLQLVERAPRAVEVRWRVDLWPTPILKRAVINTELFLGRGGLRAWTKSAHEMLAYYAEDMLREIVPEGEC